MGANPLWSTLHMRTYMAAAAPAALACPQLIQMGHDQVRVIQVSSGAQSHEFRFPCR